MNVACSLIQFVLLAVVTTYASVALPDIFKDNMVLQRNMKTPIWGTAASGESVTVQFAGQTKITVAASNGTWRILLDSMAASTVSRQLIVSGTNTIALSTVLVGDVWLLNGQSNMEEKFMWRSENFYDDTLTKATYPLLRYTDFSFGWPWISCSPQSVDSFCITGYYFGRDILLALNQQVPVGLIDCSAGGTSIEQWMQSKSNLPDSKYPTLLAPVVGFGIRGMAWYQGEANDINASAYAGLLSTAIREWRTQWNQGNFPFLIVQLPSNGSVQTAPVETTAPWPLIREGQLLALSEPNTGLAITTDMSKADAHDIHPLRKFVAGKRLALWARSMVYQQTGFVSSGPIFKSMTISGNKATIKFYKKADGLVRQDSTLMGFAIRGSNGQFYTATASIKNDTTVEVSSSLVSSPVAVRYNWGMNPIGNLVNNAGIPASQFRTDGPQLPCGLFNEPCDPPTAIAHEAPSKELGQKNLPSYEVNQNLHITDIRGRRYQAKAPLKTGIYLIQKSNSSKAHLRMIMQK